MYEFSLASFKAWNYVQNLSPPQWFFFSISDPAKVSQIHHPILKDIESMWRADFQSLKIVVNEWFCRLLKVISPKQYLISYFKWFRKLPAMETYLRIVSILVAWNYAKIYLHHSDFFYSKTSNQHISILSLLSNEKGKN